MMQFPSAIAALLVVAAAALLGAAAGSGLYDDVEAVVKLDKSNFAKTVFGTDHVWVVEFYAPWCGHCKNFAPEFAKAAKAEFGFVRFGAVNCDEGSGGEPELCGAFNVQGFPTVKLFPSERKKTAKGIIKEPQDYQGPRTAAALATAAEALLPDPPTLLTDQNADQWLATPSSRDGGEALPKVILFTDKPRSATLYKALCLNLRIGLDMAEVRGGKAPKLAERFGVTQFPTLLVIPDPGAEPIKYAGPIKYIELFKFLFSHARPPKDAEEAKRDQERRTSEADPQEWELQRITSAADWERACVSKQGVCAVAVLDPMNMSPEEIETYVGMLRELAALYRGKLHVMWLGALEQPQFVETFDLRSGFPALVAVNPKRIATSTSNGRYTRFVGAFAVDSLTNFFDALLAGRKGAVELDKPIFIADIDPADFLPPKIEEELEPEPMAEKDESANKHEEL